MKIKVLYGKIDNKIALLSVDEVISDGKKVKVNNATPKKQIGKGSINEAEVKGYQEKK